MKVALSAYPYCHQPPTCPCNLCWCFCSLTVPCTAGWSLLSKDLCGSFLGYQPCPQHHRDFCGLLLALWAHSLCCRACVHLFQLTKSSFYVLELVCIWFGSLGSPSMLQSLCVLLSSPWTFSLHHKGYVCCRDLYAMPHLTPWPTLCTTGLLWASVGSLSLPLGQGHRLWAVYRLRSAAFSVFLPSKFQLCLAFPDSATPLWGPLWRSCSVHRNSSCFTTPSFPWGTTPIQKFSIFSLLMSPLSLLPYSRELSLSPLEACSLLLSPRGWFVGIVLNLDEFSEVDFGGGWPSLHLTPLPSFSVLYLGFIYLFIFPCTWFVIS